MPHLLQLLIIFLRSQLFFRIIVVSAQNNHTFVWESNESGIFSHLFQLKFVRNVAAALNRSLSIASFSTSHNSDSKQIVLCDIFEFSDIGCQRSIVPQKNKCNRTLTREVVSNRQKRVCFSGLLWGKSGIVPPKHRLSVMFLQPRLKFQANYFLKFLQVHREITRIVNQETFTVVHWRRGDQLSTRCKSNWHGLKDDSINCKTATELMRDVRRGDGGNKKEPVLIATNEKNTSVLDALRGNGYVLFEDIFSRFPKMTSLEQFMVEVQTMINATSFISYGISNVNDMVEFERLQLGKTWCIKPPAVHGEGSWCNIYKDAFIRRNNKYGSRFFANKTYDTAAMRAIGTSTEEGQKATLNYGLESVAHLIKVGHAVEVAAARANKTKSSSKKKKAQYAALGKSNKSLKPIRPPGDVSGGGAAKTLKHIKKALAKTSTSVEATTATR